MPLFFLHLNNVDKTLVFYVPFHLEKKVAGVRSDKKEEWGTEVMNFFDKIGV